MIIVSNKKCILVLFPYFLQIQNEFQTYNSKSNMVTDRSSPGCLCLAKSGIHEHIGAHHTSILFKTEGRRDNPHNLYFIT